MSTFTTEAQLAEALSASYRLENTMLQTRIERLTAIISEHGIPLPGDDPRLGASDGDHLAACRRVVIAAYDLLEQTNELESALTDLKTMVGSGMEFVNQKTWRG